ncbi:TPA: ATP-binding cassette domain-containing protein, partial [Enterococcus faecium]
YLNNKSISYMKYIEFTRSLIYVSKNEGFVLESLKEELNLNLNDNIANQVIEILNLDRIIQKLKNGLEESCLDLELYLSTGEIQRLRIARALMREPKVLILDEVLTNIDEESSQKIIYQISDVFDMTIICVEHHIKESTFDKVFIINEKKLIEKSYKRIGGENNEKSN